MGMVKIAKITLNVWSLSFHTNVHRFVVHFCMSYQLAPLHRLLKLLLLISKKCFYGQQRLLQEYIPLSKDAFILVTLVISTRIVPTRPSKIPPKISLLPQVSPVLLQGINLLRKLLKIYSQDFGETSSKIFPITRPRFFPEVSTPISPVIIEFISTRIDSNIFTMILILIYK